MAVGLGTLAAQAAGRPPRLSGKWGGFRTLNVRNDGVWVVGSGVYRFMGPGMRDLAGDFVVLLVSLAFLDSDRL